MADYYVFFRTWRHFTKQFAFDDFNILPDKEINDAMDLHALNWLRETKASVRDCLRRKRRKLKKAIEARRRQVYPTPPAIRVPLDMIRGRRTNDLACRIACIAGWVDYLNLATLSELSPSRMLMVYRGDRNTADIVLEILKDQFSHSDYDDYFKLRFGRIAADTLSKGEPVSFVHRAKNAVWKKTDDPTVEIPVSTGASRTACSTSAT